MFRRVFPLVCFLAVLVTASLPSQQALAHGGDVHAARTAVAAMDETAPLAIEVGEAGAAAQSMQSYPQSGEQPLSDNDCHCPACHGCCHAPALSDAPAQLAPLPLSSHAAPGEDGWLARRWRSAIENPPKTFA